MVYLKNESIKIHTFSNASYNALNIEEIIA